MKLIVSFLLLFISVYSPAPQKDQLKFVSGNVTFEIRNAGINVKGSMEGVAAEINFNMQKPQEGSISGTADPSTIKTGIGMRDKHLKNEDYFDVEKYPLVNMTSNSLILLEDGSYEGIFTLTIKDISKVYTLPFKVMSNDGLMQFTTSFEINRQDFGLGEDSLILSDDVTIHITLAAE